MFLHVNQLSLGPAIDLRVGTVLLCHHTTFATFKQPTMKAASSSADTVAASLLASFMMS